MDEKLNEGDILTTDQIIALAKQLFDKAGESQEALGAKIQRNQAQISRALKGEPRYVKTCVDIVEAYADCEIQYPVGWVKSMSGE